jgi:hypothetical protein
VCCTSHAVIVAMSAPVASWRLSRESSPSGTQQLVGVPSDPGEGGDFCLRFRLLRMSGTSWRTPGTSRRTSGMSWRRWGTSRRTLGAPWHMCASRPCSLSGVFRDHAAS